jgi:DNA-binding beta-propeller fold protein YncE
LVGGFDSGNLVRISRADWKVKKRIPTGGAIDRIRLSADGRTAWINNLAHDTLYRYDMATDRITARLRTGPKPNNVRLTPDGRYAYIACRGPNNPQNYLWRSPRNGRIQLVDLEALKIVEDFEAGNQAVGLDVSPDGRFLAFTNLQDATVELYEILEQAKR